MKISEAPLGQRLLCKYSGGATNISGIPMPLLQITKVEEYKNGHAVFLRIEHPPGSSSFGWYDAKEVDSKLEIFAAGEAR